MKFNPNSKWKSNRLNSQGWSSHLVRRVLGGLRPGARSGGILVVVLSPDQSIELNREELQERLECQNAIQVSKALSAKPTQTRLLHFLNRQSHRNQHHEAGG